MCVEFAKNISVIGQPMLHRFDIFIVSETALGLLLVDRSYDHTNKIPDKLRFQIFLVWFKIFKINFNID